MLHCNGKIIPFKGCTSYSIRISYKMGHIPDVYIINPQIQPRAEYHMYADGKLCLYDWREMPWRAHMDLHETIIPWTSEWIVFYELWCLTGKWLGAASMHGTEEKKSEPLG